MKIRMKIKMTILAAAKPLKSLSGGAAALLQIKSRPPPANHMLYICLSSPFLFTQTKPMATHVFSFLLLALLAAPLTLARQQSRYSHLQFYIHDKISGPNATAVKVAAASDSILRHPSATGLHFSSGYVVDDLVTKGPDPASEPVGRARGFYTVSSLDGSDLYFSVQVLFTEGPYKGSSVAVAGSDPIMEEVRELPVMGGTGHFRLARGFVLMRTHSFGTATGNAVLLVDAYILKHY